MVTTLHAFSSLFYAVFILLSGVGLLSTFLSLRMTVEGYSAQVTGLVMSGFFVGLIIGSFICHRLIQRVGHIRSFAVFAALCSASVLVHGLCMSPWIWALLRVITGIVIIGLYMVIESWLNECAQPEERGRVFSVYMLTTYLGLGVGQFLLMAADVMRPDYFMIIGILFTMSIVPVSVTGSINPQMPERVAFNVFKIIRKAPLGMAGCLAAGMLNSTIYSLGPVFAYNIGLPINQVSLFMGFVILSGMAFQYPIGMLSDRFDRSLVLGALGLAVAIAAGLIIAYPGERSLYLLGLSVVYGGLAFTIYPVAVAHSHDFFEPSEIVAVSSALLLSFGIGGSVGPTLASLFMVPPLGAKGMFAFIALVSGFYGMAVLWVRTRRPEHLEVEDPVPFMVTRSTSPAAAVLDPRSDPIEPEDFFNTEPVMTGSASSDLEDSIERPPVLSGAC